MFKDIKLFLFDMDGTLYLGDRLFDFTTELLSEIRKKGKRYMFMTNNSSKSVSAYIEKLGRLGITACESDFITSAQATIHYRKKHHANKRLYVCGTESLKREFAASGLIVTENTATAECVVMGYDTELTYKKLYEVSHMLTTRDMPYIATHPDKVCPTEWGSVPDCGSFCDMIYVATGKQPLVIGKPEKLMPCLAMEKANVKPSETAVIGDRIYTDVKCGLNAGALGVLVMSGETTQKILEESSDKPDVVLNNAGEIISQL